MAYENSMYAYALDSYLHYIRGDDDSVEALDGDFMKKLEQERDAVVEKVKGLEKDASELKARVDALKTGPSQRELLERDKSVLEGDEKKFKTIIEEYERRNVKLKNALEEKEKELTTKEEETRRICKENEELKKTVESQSFNTRDVERMKKEMQAVEREIADAEVERNSSEEKCWDLDTTLGHKLKELEELAKECNKTIRKLVKNLPKREKKSLHSIFGNSDSFVSLLLLCYDLINRWSRFFEIINCDFSWNIRFLMHFVRLSVS